MSDQTLLKLTNDYIFKRTFGYEGAERVTSIFLRDIFKTKVTDVKLDNSTITEKEIITDKVGIMDIKAVVNKNIQCDIEMQVVAQSDIEQRIMFYWSKMYTKTISKGEGYGILNKSIVVLIADFELDTLKPIKKYMTKWNIREEEYSKIILTDVLEIYIIELPKFSKYVQKQESKCINLWVKFIKNPEVIMMVNENDCKDVKETKQAINDAKEKLKQLSESEHERELAELRDKYIRDQYSVRKYGYLKGKEEGRIKGFEEGKSKEKYEIAKKMLAQQISIDVIIECTGLTKKEIEQI
ncbi:MAG: Rpn family recombination-promoting nuclease/putative transposase [Clostridia bacterium]|nr:Rpn family recombination-promoting nuclease/putative transposase [Clostridia bacterium]